MRKLGFSVRRALKWWFYLDWDFFKKRSSNDFFIAPKKKSQKFWNSMQGFKSCNPSIVMIVKLFSVHGQVPAWIFKIFLAKQLLFGHYEKVILWLFFKYASVSIKSSFYPLPDRKTQFSQKDIERSLIFCVFYLPIS